jgi:hypothetical protein
VLAGVPLHVDLVDRGPNEALERVADATAGPAIVNTDRLWLASLVRSRRWTPSTLEIAVASSSTTSRRRPSETFGTDSTRRSSRLRSAMAQSCHPAGGSRGPSRGPVAVD